jgi:hypothetical protein
VAPNAKSRLLGLLAVVAGLAGVAGATVGLSATKAPAYFETPSGNIACAWFADFDTPAKTYLRCEIGSLLRPLPKRPASCDVDWGYGLTLGNRGRAAVLCAGDTIRRAGRRAVLAYGTTWRKRGFTCRSESVGLTCRNTAGHGFFLSRERWRRF